jgi:hypothetical protein
MPAQDDNRTVQDLRTGGVSATGGRAYQPPRLLCYGDVGSITQANNMGNSADGATMGQVKTLP